MSFQPIKSYTGAHTYDTGKKNAVVQVENTGNLIQGTASLTYNAFNKVATVVQGTNTLTITYGPDRQRTKTVLVNGSNTTTTLYADNYEQRTVNGTTTTYHYVASPDGMIAVYVKKNGTTTPYYVETDHLGSIINLFDASGTKQFSASYDAWGKQTISKNAIGLTRGYTGHEHWNQFGLIDMNGRFYDPLIGRFLSPDPYMQNPSNLQNFNRYSYCLNNPLKYTDPSGNIVMTATVMGIFISAYMGAIINVGAQGVAGNVNSVGDFFLYSSIGSLAGFAGGYAGLAAGSICGGFGGGFCSGFAGGFTGGFITGAGNSWGNGDSFSDGLAKGGMTGLASGLVAGTISGIAGGINSVRHGGNFWTGNGASYECSAIGGVDNNVEVGEGMEYSNKYAKNFFDEFWGPNKSLNAIYADGTCPGGYSMTENNAYFTKGGDHRALGIAHKVARGKFDIFLSKAAFVSKERLYITMGHENLHIIMFTNGYKDANFHHTTISKWQYDQARLWNFDVEYYKNYMEYFKGNRTLYTTFNYPLLNIKPW